MPKAIFVAPPLATADIPTTGDIVTITNVRVVKEQWTSIGTCKLGLGLGVKYKEAEYSQLFSLDRPVLTGSIGRLLISVGIDDTEDPDFEAKIQKLVGRQIRVLKKGGKLYWYP